MSKSCLFVDCLLLMTSRVHLPSVDCLPFAASGAYFFPHAASGCIRSRGEGVLGHSHLPSGSELFVSFLEYLSGASLDREKTIPLFCLWFLRSTYDYRGQLTFLRRQGHGKTALL